MVLFETVMCFRTEQTHKAECEILFHSDIRTDLSGYSVSGHCIREFILATRDSLERWPQATDPMEPWKTRWDSQQTEEKGSKSPSTEHSAR